MDNTKNWDRYLKGVAYNNSLDPPTNTKYETNWNMFLGNQYINGNLGDLPKPVFNIIKRIITYFVASLTSSNVKVQWEELLMRDEQELDKEAAEILTSEFQQFMEDNKLNDKIIEWYTDGAVTGDMCARLWLDTEAQPYDGKLNNTDVAVKGKIMVDVIQGNHVYFGNPNIGCVEKQPYIQIEARELIGNLKKEMKSKQDIVSDSPSDAFDMLNGDIEIKGKDNDKTTVIYTYERKNGMIVESKDTQGVSIYSDKKTGMKRYPIAWGNWQTVKNQYHGHDVVTEVVPNQIFINRAFALAMFNLMQTAFPIRLYDKNRVAAPSNAVGQSLGVDRNPGERLGEFLDFARPGDMSGQVMPLIDMAMQYTKEVMGINDGALGSVDPTQASGVAIVSVQKQAEVPLGIPKSNGYSFLEDISNIFCEMSSLYYGIRPVLLDGEDGKEVVYYDFDNLQNALVKNNIEIGAASYWSEIAATQTLDSLFATDKITALEYFERVPDSYIIDRAGLISAREQEEGVAQEDEYEQMARVLESLPPEQRAFIEQQPPEQQEIMLRQLMSTQQIAG